MNTTLLRPYQSNVIEEFHRRIAAGIRRIILVAPTGSGKTIVGADIIRDYVRRGKAVMVLAHRREIVAQTSQKLFDVGISHGIIQAGIRPRQLELVQVAGSEPTTP
jgi:DNA repair protein RadD